MTVFRQEFTVKEMDFVHAGEASVHIKNLLKEVGADPELIRRVAIASYEAEMNAVVYGKNGRMALEIGPDEIVITVEDDGPGIPDIELAMQEGYSTATPEIREMGFGAGMGLPNIKKNSDDMTLTSDVGCGTDLCMVFRSGWGGNDD
jgi:anti-sigma regulatory factor (Ser/Thr protein kinase)